MMIMKVEQRRRQYRAAIAGIGKVSYQKKYDQAMSGRDPKAAIAAKCLDCMYWQRTRITECPIVCCPLWPYRPFACERTLESPALPEKSKKQDGPKSSADRHASHTKSSARTRK